MSIDLKWLLNTNSETKVRRTGETDSVYRQRRYNDNITGQSRRRKALDQHIDELSGILEESEAHRCSQRPKKRARRGKCDILEDTAALFKECLGTPTSSNTSISAQEAEAAYMRLLASLTPTSSSNNTSAATNSAANSSASAEVDDNELLVGFEELLELDVQASPVHSNTSAEEAETESLSKLRDSPEPSYERDVEIASGHTVLIPLL